MKKFLSSVMVFAVFTFSLACGMAFCPVQTVAASDAISDAIEAPQQADAPPCHEKQKKAEKETPADCHFMTNMDCWGVDLIHANSGHDFSDTADLSDLDLSWTYLSVNYDVFFKDKNSIRGPPFDGSSSHLNTRDLYLTTQRLRI